MQMFGLTPAEARLARAVAEGIRPEEYAGEAGVSVATAHTQLCVIFQKTGTDRQDGLATSFAQIPSVR